MAHESCVVFFPSAQERGPSQIGSWREEWRGVFSELKSLLLRVGVGGRGARCSGFFRI